MNLHIFVRIRMYVPAECTHNFRELSREKKNWLDVSCVFNLTCTLQSKKSNLHYLSFFENYNWSIMKSKVGHTVSSETEKKAAGTRTSYMCNVCASVNYFVNFFVTTVYDIDIQIGVQTAQRLFWENIFKTFKNN